MRCHPRVAAAIAMTPVAITSAKYAGSRSAITAVPSALEPVEIAQQPQVEAEAHDARGGGGTEHAGVAAEEGIHARREQPQLQDDDEGDDGEDAARDGDLLGSGKLGARGHAVRASIPVATTHPSRTSSTTRARGRRGGPAIGRPVRSSKAPWWHGQTSSPRSTAGSTGHVRWVHCCSYATKVASSTRTRRRLGLPAG